MRLMDQVERFDATERRWAVGTSPASVVHRMIGRFPGNNAVLTACGNHICLHGEDPNVAEFWTRPGRSFGSLDEVPARYQVCLKCVAKDETVE